MKTYHKINTIFRRDLGGTNKLIIGDWSLPEFEYLQNAEWEFTEKVDGTNIRLHFTYDGEWVTGKIGGRTDKADIPKDLKAALDEILGRWDFKLPLEHIMKDREIEAITLYGEGYGPGIHGGGKYSDHPAFVLFDVRVGEWWLDRSACEDIAERLGLDIVPIIGYGTLHDAVALVKGDTRRRVELWDEEVVEFHKRFIEGPLKSTWGDFEAEGVVARPLVPLFNRKMERIIAKVKVRDF